jgi:alpha-L-rhamnosidase
MTLRLLHALLTLLIVIGLSFVLSAGVSLLAYQSTKLKPVGLRAEYKVNPLGIDSRKPRLSRQYPSWLFPVKQGATTIWERWDGQKPDGSFQDVGMNSFNHYAYGAIGEWMYRVMAGIEIDPSAPGYKQILIQPQPGGGFTGAKASHQTMYGKVGSAWTIKDGKFELAVEIPANTKARVRLPKAQLAGVTESGQALTVGNGITGSRQDGDAVVVEVGSGQYRFAYRVATKG